MDKEARITPDLGQRNSTTVDMIKAQGETHSHSLFAMMSLSQIKSVFQSCVKDCEYCYHVFNEELKLTLVKQKTKKVLWIALLLILCIVCILYWSNSTNSISLMSFSYLLVFDLFSLLTFMVSLWVQNKKPSSSYSFGYERFEVLAVFSSTLMAQLGSLFILKGSVERMIEQPVVVTDRLVLGVLVGFVSHLLVTYSVDNKAFGHVIAASSSSWLQEHVADMSESICRILPGLSKLLLPRVNPFALVALAACIALFCVQILVDSYSYYLSDTLAAVWIALMTAGTMFPMAVYSGKILLQTTPSHLISELDKCLREASTLDGVLEFRKENFWTLNFGEMGGSVHVRVRRDADEQLVLAHLSNRLSNLIAVLTIQIFKDDWLRPPATYQIQGDQTLLASKFPVPFSKSTFPVAPSSSPAVPLSKLASGISREMSLRLPFPIAGPACSILKTPVATTTISSKYMPPKVATNPFAFKATSS